MNKKCDKCCQRQDFSRTYAKDQGHSDPQPVCDTLQVKDVFTDEIWDFYFKETRSVTLNIFRKKNIFVLNHL